MFHSNCRAPPFPEFPPGHPPRANILPSFSIPFVLLFIQTTSPANPFFCYSCKLPGGCGYPRTLHLFTLLLRAASHLSSFQSFAHSLQKHRGVCTQNHSRSGTQPAPPICPLPTPLKRAKIPVPHKGALPRHDPSNR